MLGLGSRQLAVINNKENDQGTQTTAVMNMEQKLKHVLILLLLFTAH